MPYDIENRLVVGLASSALFDLQHSDAVFREKGERAYRVYQREHQDQPLEPGVAFPFVRRLLALNTLDPANPPVEVVLLSHNDPDTGLRVFNSIEHYGLGIQRAVFQQGRSPHEFIPAFNISLFLSANEADVQQAMSLGLPAGLVLDSHTADDPADDELRLAFDFDGVLADDESEQVYQQGDLEQFQQHEKARADIPHNPGPLKDFLAKIAKIQQLEQEQAESDENYRPRLRLAIVTARSAPAHARVIKTMRSWDLMVNDAFFLGGVEKRRVLEVWAPHIFFDDQRGHLDAAAGVSPSVHIPFGIANQ
ncbi:5'-nucleotidase [Motiliproteus coralliicola]|uniref:5'-nucleotidase n=1 Tax=Motiliproteus coralliicola TaxID=2283196 RepID=A0A369WF05_9GAMM|nr:5'-nucleotidase [Motiliproteus coralliicola]RDE19883.1 5'-nucleotidase [Motiliproteus coralliicola]